jgi:Arc/MetJ-type ribon-helix-helix transcriptional regulator
MRSKPDCIPNTKITNSERAEFERCAKLIQESYSEYCRRAVLKTNEKIIYKKMKDVRIFIKLDAENMKNSLPQSRISHLERLEMEKCAKTLGLSVSEYVRYAVRERNANIENEYAMRIKFIKGD